MHWVAVADHSPQCTADSDPEAAETPSPVPHIATQPVLGTIDEGICWCARHRTSDIGNAPGRATIEAETATARDDDAVTQPVPEVKPRPLSSKHACAVPATQVEPLTARLPVRHVACDTQPVPDWNRFLPVAPVKVAQSATSSTSPAAIHIRVALS